jgi:hypothetical protein
MSLIVNKVVPASGTAVASLLPLPPPPENAPLAEGLSNHQAADHAPNRLPKRSIDRAKV